MASGRPRSANRRWKAVKAPGSRVDCRASHIRMKREAWSVTVRGVTVRAVAETELALEVGAPQRVGLCDVHEGCAHGLVTPRLGALHKAMAIEHGMDRALGGDAHIAVLTLEQASHEAQTFFHRRTLLPGHLHLLPKSGKCYPCVRYDLSPMSRVAHILIIKLKSR